MFQIDYEVQGVESMMHFQYAMPEQTHLGIYGFRRKIIRKWEKLLIYFPGYIRNRTLRMRR